MDIKEELEILDRINDLLDKIDDLSNNKENKEVK